MLKIPCRVRFAPSPTGNLHLGSLRTALFNFLFAKKNAGVFALRIEDTDRQRLVPGSAEQFEHTLNAYGLKVDESPSMGGPFWPYVQSERLHLYKFYQDMLVDSGHAYPCFCTQERLDILRRSAQLQKLNASYDGRCRALSRSEIDSRIANREPHVIRLKFDPGQVHFRDTIFDECVHDVDEGDFVLVKSDGFPTYHFANVVDDHCMQVTHVVRGAEWLPSTPKHIRLYEAFGWRQPAWVHLPLITRDGSRKLSKRNADAFVTHYDREQGYLPLAVLNFLLRNGSGIRNFDPEHLYTVEEMVENFDERLLTRNSFMIDPARLRNYGKMAFRAADFDAVLLPAIADRVRTHFQEQSIEVDESLLAPDYVRRVVEFLRKNEEAFDKLSELTHGRFRFFFHWPKEAIGSRILQRMPAETAVKWLQKILAQSFPSGWLHESFRQLADNTPLTTDEVLQSSEEASANDERRVTALQLSRLLRISLIGEVSGPPIAELIDFFSAEECRHRVSATIRLLLADGEEVESPDAKSSQNASYNKNSAQTK